MVIVFAVQRWQRYLLNQKFIVRTNQQAVKFLEQRMTAWVSTMDF